MSSHPAPEPTTTEQEGRWRARRVFVRVRQVLAAVLLLALAVAVTALPTTVFPDTAAVPEGVDALVVLPAEGDAELTRAVHWVERGAVAVLAVVVPPEADRAWPAAAGLCADPPVPLACLPAEQATVPAAARALADTAHEARWQAVAVVAPRHAVTRQRLWLQRCLDADVEVDAVAAPSELEPLDQVVAVVAELPPLGWDVAVRRDC